MQNELLMIQTRYTARPIHNQYRISLQKKPWVGSKADFAVAMHGPKLPDDSTELLWLNAAVKQNQVRYVLDLCEKTTGGLPPFLEKVLDWGMRLGYKYVGVFDDDAYFTYPIRTAEQIIEAFNAEVPIIQRGSAVGFEIDKPAGCIGSMGALRYQWRYKLDEGREPDAMEPLYRAPWACLGNQIYRAEALQSIDLTFLRELKFRADAIISLLLVGKGWGNYECPIPFNHTVSAGLNFNPQSDEELAGFHKMRMEQVAHDYEIYRREVRKQCGEDYYQQVIRHITSLEASELAHNQKKYKKFSR